MDRRLLDVSRRERRQYRALWLAEHLARTVLRRDSRLTARRERVHEALTATVAELGEGPRPLERREDLGPDEFEERYRRPGIPVVFAGAAKSWPCTRRWTPSFLRERCADDLERMLQVAPGQRPVPGAGRDVTIAEIVESMEAGGELYARFSGLLHRHPELVEDLDVDWLRARRRRPGAFENWGFFMGGAGTATGLHASIAPNLFVEAQGEKRWSILPPALAPFLRPTVRCAPYFTSAVDLHGKGPGWVDCLPRYTGVIGAGDVLWVPAFAWHQVENLTATVAVGYRWMSPVEGLRASALHTLIAATSTNPLPWRAKGHRDLPVLLDQIEY